MVGIGLIIRAGPIGTGVGVILVIPGLIGRMPTLCYLLATDRPDGEEWGTG